MRHREAGLVLPLGCRACHSGTLTLQTVFSGPARPNALFLSPERRLDVLTKVGHLCASDDHGHDALSVSRGLSPYRSASRAKPGCRRVSRRAGPAGRGSIPRQTIHRLVSRALGGRCPAPPVSMRPRLVSSSSRTPPRSGMHGTARTHDRGGLERPRATMAAVGLRGRGGRASPGATRARYDGVPDERRRHRYGGDRVPRRPADEALMEAFRDGRAEAFEILRGVTRTGCSASFIEASTTALAPKSSYRRCSCG